MAKNKTIKNIIEVTASNITSIVSGIIVGFIIPKLLSINDYGLYKTFTLYTTYVGLFNLGIADGIVLKYGNYDYNQLERNKFRAFFRYYFLIHLFFALGMILVGIFLLDGDYRFIVLALAIRMISTNCTAYFQQISQITQRFEELTMRRIIQSAINILSAGIVFGVFVISGETSYRLYVVLLLVLETLLTGWYCYTYRDIVFGVAETYKNTYLDIISLIKDGFPLLFANLCATLILTLDRQFVNVLFDNSTYAVYAFAYNMLSLVTVATSAVSTVLYPTLKRTTERTLNESYNLLISVVLAFVFFAMLGYYPLSIFVNWYLPKYSEALVIFRVIFPGLAISSCVTVIMHNYYKVLGQNIDFFKKSILVLILSGITNGIAYYLFRTTISISIASVITMVFWYVYSEQYFVRNYKINRFSNLFYMLILIFVFYGVTSINSIWISGALYLLLYVSITFLLKGKELKTALKLFLQ